MCKGLSRLVPTITAGNTVFRRLQGKECSHKPGKKEFTVSMTGNVSKGSVAFFNEAISALVNSL